MTEFYLMGGGFLFLFAALVVHVNLQLRDFRAALRGLDEEQGKIEASYAALLGESLSRQSDHEIEYRHKGGQTTSLRVETIARRFEKKVRAAGLPSIDRHEARRRVREALCLRTG